MPEPLDKLTQIQLKARLQTLDIECQTLRGKLMEAQSERDRVERAIEWPAVNLTRRWNKTDIAIKCHDCGRLTKWRNPNRVAKCYPECVTRVASQRQQVKQELWDIINSDDPAGALTAMASRLGLKVVPSGD